MNIELLEKVRKHILEEPKRVNMSKWVYRKFDIKVLIPKDRQPKCNTVACIGGWATVLGSKKKVNSDYQIVATKLLDLQHYEASKLFHVSNWPVNFQSKIYLTYPNTRAYARVVSARIKHFIKTEGRE